MDKKRQHILLKDIEVYKLARELSEIGWKIYQPLDWQVKKIMGDQFITATDSFGANIAEGYSRFHFLEKIKFFYTARASLAEASEHWIQLLFERGFVQEAQANLFKQTAGIAAIKLQHFINSIYRSKDKIS